ncbi:unnamed protein product, partial [Arctogadus glacialis]
PSSRGKMVVTLVDRPGQWNGRLTQQTPSQPIRSPSRQRYIGSPPQQETAAGAGVAAISRVLGKNVF